MQPIERKSLIYASRPVINIQNNPQTKFIRIPTTIVMQDPCLRCIHAAVHMCLYDHPYPANKFEFRRRTLEIHEQINCLNFPVDRQQFLKDLITDTDVKLVS